MDVNQVVIFEKRVYLKPEGMTVGHFRYSMRKFDPDLTQRPRFRTTVAAGVARMPSSG